MCEADDHYDDEQIPIVISRPTRFTTVGKDTGNVVTVRQVNNRSYDFRRIIDTLPVREPPPRGYHFGSDLPCRGCRNIIVHVIWDGGAEGTSISDTCLSSILREQSRQGLPPEKCGFNYMSRMSPHQSFVGFANHNDPDGSIKVEIQGQLQLEKPGGDAFPPLDV